MLASALLAVAVLSYMVWQAATLPAEGDPSVTVTSVEETPEGDVRVHVRIVNHAAAGYRLVNVEVDCDDPAPDVDVANLPATGERRIVLTCPAGTTSPQARITALVPT